MPLPAKLPPPTFHTSAALGDAFAGGGVGAVKECECRNKGVDYGPDTAFDECERAVPHGIFDYAPWQPDEPVYPIVVAAFAIVAGIEHFKGIVQRLERAVHHKVIVDGIDKTQRGEGDV